MGAIISAVFSFLLRSVLIKFCAFFALYFITTGFMGYLSSLLPPVSSISSSFAAWTPAIWYFADIGSLTVGFPMVISASILAFSIRRMPVIG